MPNVTYENFRAPAISAEWLNEVGRAVYLAIGNGTNAPATPEEVKANLGLAGGLSNVLPNTGGDVTSQLQAAIDGTYAAGGGEVLLAPGVYLVTSIFLKSGVRLRGVGRDQVTIRRIPGAANQFVVRATNCLGAEIADLTVDLALDAGTDGNGIVGVNATGEVSNFAIQRVRFLPGNIRPYVDLRQTVASQNILIRDCLFWGSDVLFPKPPPPPGTFGTPQLSSGVRVLTSAPLANVVLETCLFRRMATAWQFRASVVNRQLVRDHYQNVIVRGNICYDNIDDPNVGGNTELHNCSQFALVANTFKRLGRGVGLSYSDSGVVVGNVADGEGIYFAEIQSVGSVSFSGNTATNCKTFINDTGDITPGYGAPPSRGITISGNVVEGGDIGIPGFNTDRNAIAITTRPYVGTGYEDWLIEGNLFRNFRFSGSLPGSAGAGGILRVDGDLTKRITFRDNKVIQDDESCGTSVVTLIAGSDIRIEQNTIIRPADVSETTFDLATASMTFIALGGSAVTDVAVKDNTIIFTGAVTKSGLTTVIGIGSNISPTLKTGVEVCGNTIVGGAFTAPLFLPYTSGDTFVLDNDTYRAGGTDSLNSAIQYRSLRRRFDASASPSSGTWKRGDFVFHNNPTAGGLLGWRCVTGGTPGTWETIFVGGGGGGGGVTDHGDLSGLGDDDHTQYFNQTRGDARYLQLTDASETIDDRVAALLVAGSGISLTYNDPANTLTVTSTVSGTNLESDLENAGTDNAKGTALIGHFVATGVGGTPYYTRPIRDKLREEVHLTDFGPVGVGYSQDQAVWNKALWWLENNGGTLILPTGLIYLEQIDLATSFGAITIRGQGPGATVLEALGDRTAITCTGSFHSITLENFLLDCRWNLIGSTDPTAAATANHGISIRDVGGSQAANPGGRLTIRNLVVQNYKNSGILLFSNSVGVHKQYLVENCHVYGGFDYLGSPGPVTNNGILLENVSDSAIRNCSARNIRGAPGYGIQLKNTCTNCWLDSPTAVNCTGGVIFGYTTGTGVNQSRISNAVALNCGNAFDAREAVRNSIHFSMIDQEAANDHAVVFSTNCAENDLQVDVARRVAANKRIVLFGTDVRDSNADIGEAIECNVTGDRHLVQFSSTATHNFAKLSRFYTATGPSRIPGAAPRGGVDLGTGLTNAYKHDGYQMVEYCVISGTTITQKNMAADGVMVDTSSGAGTLSTISTAAFEGKTLHIRCGSSARPITVQEGGNIELVGNVSFLLDNTKDVLVLRYNGTDWCEVSRANVA